jgi:phosphoglycerate dehydrogenase-like enzyme
MIVVEDDPFLRVVQVILDPKTPARRVDAFSHFFAADLEDFPAWCERLRSRITHLYPAQVQLVRNEAELIERLPGAQIVVVESLTIGANEVTTAGPTLRLVQKYGSLARNIDRQTCEDHGISVLTLRRRANIATAEHALALMLAMARKLVQTANLVTVEQMRNAGYEPTRYDVDHTPNGNWARVKGLQTLFGLQLGIVGMGEIGRELALRVAPLGMRMVYTQRRQIPKSDEERYQATYCTLDDLLASSDYVSVHLPGGVGTRGLIGKRELERVKPGASLINVSQPQIIDREALLESLISGRLGGFAMDLPYEEPGQPDDPLMQLPNVIVTPHLGGSPRFNALSDFEEMLLNLDQGLGN